MTDPKEQIRQLVAASLAAALQQHSADAVVAALARSLQANRAPKVKCAVMAFFAAAARGSSASSVAGGSEGDKQEASAAPPLLQQLVGSGAALAGLLRSLLQLATDKNPDIRRAAADAVAAAYHGGEAAAVTAAVQALPPADVLAVQRSIGPAIQQGGRSGSSGDMPPPPPRPSSKAASRRQSSEGIKQLGSQQQQLRRPESSGNLMARSRQSSQTGSPPHIRQPAAKSAASAAAPVQLTPEPPSPFAWRGESASPLPGGDDTQAVEQQHTAMAAAREEEAAAQPVAGPEVQHQVASAVHSSADLAPFDEVMAGQLQRLLSQLDQGLSCEALQGLARLAHVLPAAAWPPCFEQVGAGQGEGGGRLLSSVRDISLVLPACLLPDLTLSHLPNQTTLQADCGSGLRSAGQRQPAGA